MTEQMPGELIYEYTIKSTGATLTATSGRTEAPTGSLAEYGKTNTSVRSRRRSSPGNLRLSALKWFDILFFLVGSDVWAGPGSAADEVEQGGVDLGGVGPGDGVRAALDDDEQHVLDQGGQPLAGLVQWQDLVRVALDD
jgi:hypothetical protein